MQTVQPPGQKLQKQGRKGGKEEEDNEYVQSTGK